MRLWEGACWRWRVRRCCSGPTSSWTRSRPSTRRAPPATAFEVAGDAARGRAAWWLVIGGTTIEGDDVTKTVALRLGAAGRRRPQAPARRRPHVAPLGERVQIAGVKFGSRARKAGFEQGYDVVRSRCRPAGRAALVLPARRCCSSRWSGGRRAPHARHMNQTHVIHRSLRATPPVAVSGEGVWLIDAGGKRYLDASGGAAVSCLGHGHPDVIAAMHAQIDQLGLCAHGLLHQRGGREARRPPGRATRPAGVETSTSSAAAPKAIEAALEAGAPVLRRDRRARAPPFIARRQSYHGNTLGALAVGGNEWRRAPVRAAADRRAARGALLRVPRPARRRDAKRSTRSACSTSWKPTIQRPARERVIAFVAETVVGATAGAVPPRRGYFKGVREICDRHGVLLIADEVMCGMGRTGTLHAVEQEGVAPDLMVDRQGPGRRLPADRRGAGARARRSRRCAPGSGLLPARPHLPRPPDRLRRRARRAARDRARRPARQRARARRAADGGAARALRRPPARRRHPRPRPVPGASSWWPTARPRRPSTRRRSCTRASRPRALANGLSCYPMGGTIDGLYGDHVLLAPPFISHRGRHRDHRRAARRVSIDEALAHEAARRARSAAADPARALDRRPARRAPQAMIAGPRGAVLAPFVPLMRSPELSATCSASASTCVTAAPSVRLTELAILVTANDYAQAVEWAIHSPIAAREGIGADTIAAIERGERPAAMATTRRWCTTLHRAAALARPVGDALGQRAVGASASRRWSTWSPPAATTPAALVMNARAPRLEAQARGAALSPSVRRSRSTTACTSGIR